MEGNITYKLSVRLFRAGKCFGPGIAELLRRVDETHSLRAAAMSMEMAYSKAWRIMKETEASLGFRLLNSTTGGPHGGGAELTPEGRDMLLKYEAFMRGLHAEADRLLEEIFSN
jgi:molybdate transport system regulatory protein